MGCLQFLDRCELQWRNLSKGVFFLIIHVSFFPKNLYVLFANAPGLVISVWLNMCATKLQYKNKVVEQPSDFALLRDSLASLVNDLDKNDEKDKEKDVEKTIRGKEDDGSDVTVKKKLSQMLVQFTPSLPPSSSIMTVHEGLVVGVVLVWIVVLSVLVFGRLSSSASELVVGLVVNLNLLFFFAAPLSTISTVLRTRSSSSIHVWTMLTNTINGAFWTAYGLAVVDPFIFVPNGIGAGLGLVQILLCVLFPRQQRKQQQQQEDDMCNVQAEDTAASEEGSRQEEMAIQPIATPEDSSQV